MTFNITERDVASTYHEGVKLYNGYNRAMELHGEGLSNRINYAVDHVPLNLNNKNTIEISEKQMNKVLELFVFAIPEFEIETGIYKQNVGKVDTNGKSIEAYHARLSLYHQTKEFMEEYFKKNIHSKPL